MLGPLRGDASRPVVRIQDNIDRLRSNVHPDRIDEGLGHIKNSIGNYARSLRA